MPWKTSLTPSLLITRQPAAVPFAGAAFGSLTGSWAHAGDPLSVIPAGINVVGGSTWPRGSTPAVLPKPPGRVCQDVPTTAPAVEYCAQTRCAVPLFDGA